MHVVLLLIGNTTNLSNWYKMTRFKFLWNKIVLQHYFAISKANHNPFWCHHDLDAANQNVNPSTPHLRIGLINYREHPVTPWCLSNHNQYMTATGHHPPCDLGPPSLTTLSLSLQRINIKPSSFCHLPITSTESTQLCCLRFKSWFKVTSEDNSNSVYFVKPYWTPHAQINR